MSTHYHLLLQTPLGNLSRITRHIGGLYTQRFNRCRRGYGPLFRGLYKAILVEADAYLWRLLRYIHLNPVREGPARVDETEIRMQVLFAVLGGAGLV